MSVIEALAYAFMRGLVRAYLDVLKERDTFHDEKITEKDSDRIANLRKLAASGMFDSSAKPDDSVK